MGKEIEWLRVGYQSRIDVLAEHVSEFVDAVLGTIDERAARASAGRWAIVCRFFAGCAQAARVQGQTPEGGAEGMAAFRTKFRCGAGGGSSEGFDEFMDWLADPEGFRPTRLKAMLERS